MLRAVRMPDELSEGANGEVPPHTATRVLFDIPDKKQTSPTVKVKPMDAEHLQVLVAEDDPINSRIIKKRLEKSGHDVQLCVNGEECASAYGEKPEFFDVVFMDMQVSP